MARSLNLVIVMGNLTRDPELKQLPSGQSVAMFSLALNRSYKDKDGEWQEATDFVDVSVFGKLAEQVSENLAKGKRALVDGRLQTRQWEVAGVKHSKTEILAQSVTFLDKVASELVTDLSM